MTAFEHYTRRFDSLQEDLQQKLNETLKEKVRHRPRGVNQAELDLTRLELRDRESYNAAYAEAAA